MASNYILKDKQAWHIVFLYAIWSRFFNFYLFSHFSYWSKIEELIILVLTIYLIPDILNGLKEKGITKNVSLLIVMFLFSTFWALLFWGQSLYTSIRGLTSSCLLLVFFFLLKKRKISIESLINAIVILCIIYCICLSIALITFPNCIFGDFSYTQNTIDDYERTLESRGALRLPVPGSDFVILTIFILISKYKNQTKMYIWLLPLFIFLLQRGTRTPLFVTTLIVFIYVIAHIKNKIIVAVVAACVYSLISLLLPVIIKSDSDNIIVKYIKTTNEQIETSQNEEEDIRIKMATYYLSDFNNGNLLRDFFGNGVPSGVSSEYGNAVNKNMKNNKFFMEDVGFVQIFVWFGIIGYIIYSKLLIKSIKVHKTQDTEFGFIYIIYLFLILPANCSLTNQPIFFAISLYALYIGELHKTHAGRILMKYEKR